MLRWFEHSQVYQPTRVLEATGAELNRPFEDVWFKARDGAKLNGWFFPGAKDSPRNRFAVLLCHGNGGNISHRLDVTAALLETGVAVFLFDYRGYGRSEGRPSEEGTYADSQAAYHWLEQKGYSGTNIIAFGESLGGGIASGLAARVPLAGLVLQATFSSLPDVGSEIFPWLPVRFLCSINYDTCRRLPRLFIPVMVMHSHGDELIKFHHAEKNYAAANHPKLLWELKGDHNDPVSDRANFLQGFEKFLRLIEDHSLQPATAESAAASAK
jgi:fermentation-respiration switch protein FrsA (DUF1100 family)